MATIRKTFTFDSEQDAPLLAWLEARPNASETVRAALWAAYQGQPGGAPASATTLADVVKAIEGLGAALSGARFVGAPMPTPAAEDPELAQALAGLGA